MRAKSILLLVVALGFGAVAAVAASQVILEQKTQETVHTTSILVVAKDLSAAAKIPADAVRLEQWASDRVPPGAITDPKAIENKFTKQRLYVGEPIIEAKLSSKGKDFSVPAGHRIFDITVRDETGGGGYIGPGDHVDVFGYFEKGTRINASKSVKVMQDLEVVMIDGIAVIDPEATTQKKSSTIQLLVKDSQYVVLDTAANLGKLRLALRPPEKVDTGRTDNGEEFMSWLKESESSPSERQQLALPILTSSNNQEPAKTEGHEMIVISSNKSTLYRWLNGQSVPQKFDLNEVEEGTSSNYSSSPALSHKPAPSQTPKPVSTSVPQTTQSTAPVDPANTVQPNLTWDPTNGLWQSGGFKAIYPGEK